MDVGCGSGQVTIPLAAYFATVVGTDNSSAQLEMALINSNPPNVTYRWDEGKGVAVWSGAEHVQLELLEVLLPATLFWLSAPRQCSAEELPFASGEVDLVMSMSAAQCFDRPKFLMEADRVLRPGGCLAAGCHTSDVELEYGDVSNTLNDICNEVHPRCQHKMYYFLNYKWLTLSTCLYFDNYSIQGTKMCSNKRVSIRCFKWLC